jgi:chromate reductase
MAKFDLLLISGSLRKGSFNRMLLAEAARLYGAPAHEADLNLPLYDGDLESSDGIPAAVQTLADQIAAAKAVVISGPEYNQSMSGVLKNALDWVSRVESNPWADKPVALVSAAAGRTGGARGQYILRLAMNPFQPVLLTGPEVLVAGAHQEFDDNGQLKSEQYEKALSGLMAKLRMQAG